MHQRVQKDKANAAQPLVWAKGATDNQNEHETGYRQHPRPATAHRATVVEKMFGAHGRSAGKGCCKGKEPFVYKNNGVNKHAIH